MRKAIAVLDSKNIKGTVKFFQEDPASKVLVVFDLYGLPKNKVMGTHIHEFGDLSEGCKSLGPHLNPGNNVHGYHAGDMIFNTYSDSKGEFKYSYFDPRINLFPELDISHSIVGRSVVIHAEPDDMGKGGNPESLKTGNAGARLAGAVIGMAN